MVLEEININGLRGRMLYIEGKTNRVRKKDILLVYGLHSSHKRMAAIAEYLADFGNVYEPDLPGIGGMDSFYKIGLTPTLDLYADYLYTFLISQKLTKNLRVVAMSFGFLVVTRMLQRHPDSRKWVKFVVSFVGFGRYSDFINYKKKRRVLLPLSRVLGTRLASWFIRRVVFNRLGLVAMFAVFSLFNPKYKHGLANDYKNSIRMEIDLWQKNDVRTRFCLYRIIFTFDLTEEKQKLPILLHNLIAPSDQYFDPGRVSESLEKIYKRVECSQAGMKLHAPSIIATRDTVNAVFSEEVRKLLAG